MKWKLALFFLAIVLSFSTKAFADPDPKFYVFLAFGQSNMEGFPGVEDQDKKGVDERFKMLAAVDFPAMGRKKGEWYTAIPPLCRPSTGLCPADYFGRTLVANLPKDIKVGVVNVSVAGCKIELFQKESFESYSATAPQWMKSIIQTYDNNPYQYLVQMGKLAQKDGVIKGILLHQGESNSGDKQWPAKVKSIYDNLIKDLNLKPEETPLLAGELVNGGMASIMAELPKQVPNAHIIDSKGCQGRPNNNPHFTPAGYRELGKRYGDEMTKLLGYEVKTPESQPASQTDARPADAPKAP